MDYKAILKKYNIEAKFPPAVLQEAGRVSAAAPDFQAAGRLDLRGEPIVTIDGEDAKDLDDAVTVKKSAGGYTLGVHIADVAHYVREGTALDREARLRGTSVYFPDRVVPMLPQELSNGICSLNPAVDRLTLSCIMEIDPQGRVTNYKIAESIIKTAARMTYDEVAALLGCEPAAPERKTALRERYAPLIPMFTDMRALKDILERARAAAGSVDFDIAETKIVVAADGAVAEVKRAPRTEAHKMIEQFMIRCNETVASHLAAKGLPCVYRIHEKPAVEKLTDLYAFLGILGFAAPGRPEQVRPADFRRLLAKIKGTPYESLLNKVLLRSMQKAVYSERNAGHFGLASRCYCHFTSPIRRYPDLMVHRILKADLSGRIDQQKGRYRRVCAAVSGDSSLRERAAVEAERAVADLKKAEYMARHIGREYDGMISGVTAFGIFVELPSTVEGLIRLDTLPDGPYTFVEKRYMIKGRGGRAFHLGGRVRVRCVRADPAQGHIDFVLCGGQTPCK